ncbi:hypothetical protein [Streptomyces chilikensis]|uniref:hypothetical protein n=1 Tax=Streptomyces chilikensis TaxID=1194079 RepID=UPI0014077C1B|nr:hypothetical protein [Streptomyces chilikensis]
MSGTGTEAGAPGARARALAVLRVRGWALGAALLPAAVLVVLVAGGATGRLTGPSWDLARLVTGVVAGLVLCAAAAVSLVVARSRPATSPTVPIPERSAPDLYRLVRDLADRLGVPAPSAIELTPDCDSWLEDRSHPAHGAGAGRRTSALRRLADPHRRDRTAPVLVIGSPFLWWMRVGELRAVLAPVVAGTGPSAHPDIAAARRFVRGLDAAMAVAADPQRRGAGRLALGAVARVVRLMLRGCAPHAAEMERGVAAAAAERAQAVDHGLRVVAQEQVGLAYAGWDRLLTRVALPAWRMRRWPSRLDVGVVAALTELSRRDRLAEGFASRLGERPACDLLEEPGAVDEATSLLAARLFHGASAGPAGQWAPVEWQEYPEEVVDRAWRTDADRLHRVLDGLGAHQDAGDRSLSRVLDHLALLTETPGPAPADGTATGPSSTDTAAGGRTPTAAAGGSGPAGSAAGDHPAPADPAGPAGGDPAPAPGVPSPPDAPSPPGEAAGHAEVPAPAAVPSPGPEAEAADPQEADGPDPLRDNERAAALAAGITAELAREEAHAAREGDRGPAAAASAAAGGPGAGSTWWDDGRLPLLPPPPPRSGRDLLADHVTAMVCCAAVDTAGAAPGLDWLDGPALLVRGERVADLGPRVLSLVEEGDPAPLRAWLRDLGVRAEKPVRLG